MSAKHHLRFTASCLVVSCAVATALATQLAAAQTVYHETEPNDSEVQANLMDGDGTGLLPGDAIIGETRCTYPCGLYGPDFFLIRTCPAPRGLYRYQLVVSSDNAHNSFVGLMLGVTKSNCQVTSTSYNLVQRTSQPVLAEWYGFGKQERVYWEILGSYTTTLPYTAILHRDAIPSFANIGPISPGLVHIDPPAGNTPTFVVFAYDANFNELPGYSGLLGFSRDFPAGTYHIAIAANYAVNDRQCPPNEFLSGRATDFPDCIVDWSGESVGILVRFSDSQARTTVVQVPASPYSVQWMTLRVYPQNTCGSADFDGDGDSGTSEDIEAFFACLAGDCCLSCDPRGADFDADGDAATDADIESFFSVLAGGSC